METYIFHGKVLPERTHVNLTGLPPINIIQPESNLNFELKISILLSEISAYVTSEEVIPDLISLKNFVTDAISFLVDCIGYENGCSYLTEIDSCSYNKGNDFVVFGVDISELKNSNNWESALNVIKAHSQGSDLQKQQLQRSLAELRRGIKITHDTGFHAYRAIEAIKLSFDDSWEKTNTALNLKQTYSDDLRKNHGNPQRHGSYTFMSSQERVEMLIKAKTVISRFVSFIQNNNQQLSQSNSPN